MTARDVPRPCASGGAASPSSADADVRRRAIAALFRAHEGEMRRAETIERLRRWKGSRPVAKVALAVFAVIALAAIGALAGPRMAKPTNVASAPSASSPIVREFPSEPPLVAASASASAEVTQPPAPSGTLPDGRVVLNLATEDDLTKLPHVGPTRAKAILALRQRLGKFRSLTELLRVKGLGRKTLAKLAPKLVVDPPAS